ncbi:uncharacterized protein [Medicago truncatula]|nr:uncharacterized protein LOC11420156 [Medicago truncatula]
MCLHPNVVNWDDSAVKEAFNNAKNRFWAEINDIPCDIPSPDPNIYIDDIDWNASVDTELYLDVEREVEACRNIEEKGEEVVILSSSLFLDQSLSGPGWGDEEDEKLTKPYEPNDVARGWESNQHGNNQKNFWKQYDAPIEHAAKEYGWKNGQNDSQGWNQREQYGGDFHNKYQGRNSGNWGTWDGYNRRRENNISWSTNPGYDHGTNEYQMNSGRRRRNGGRGGGRGWRGNYPYVDKVATPCAW